MAGFVEQLIASNTIAVNCKVADWEEAIRLGGALMKEAGLIQESYIDAIIDNHNHIGPYFIIAPGLAMPHAKPENGVVRTGYALLTLSSAVEFGDEDNDPVDLLIFAGAINREEHNQEVIPQIAELCDSAHYIQALRTAQNVPEVITTLKDFTIALAKGELD